MKNIKKYSILFLTLSTIISCTVTKKQWHDAASKVGASSIYIEEDGVVSKKIVKKTNQNHI